MGGGGWLGTNFQLFMLSPNLPEAESPISLGKGWGGNLLSTFDAEFKSVEIPKFHFL